MPGAYDWERFEADDPSQRLRLVASVFRGDPFDRDYLRRFAGYMARPTQWPPPLPAAYCGVRVDIFEADQLIAKISRPIGESTGNWRIRAEDGGATIDLTFRPRWSHPPHQRTLLAGEGNHQWIIDAPLCDVAGEVRLNGKNRAFSGLGFHDRILGRRPIALSLEKWMWGRILSPDRAVLFHQLWPTKWARQIHVVEADGAGIRQAAASEISIEPPAVCQTVFPARLG